MSTVDIVIRTTDKDSVQTAKKIQAEYDSLSKKLKEAGVSQKTYDQALKEHERVAQASTKATKQQSISFTELNSAISIVQRGIQALKSVYNFSKEGAQIDFIASKFDNLSRNIGTTSDALMTDLREATRGTMSDLELMASVTDLVGLGLAKDHDEAVRLATVSAGLGMNMNQLVLTLTNMTTMRFDALGVRVDGFKDKVKALEQQGYSTDAAFKEAFLQQAEEQLKIVGNAADTSAGQFLKFEAVWKNTMDSFKSGAAEGLTPALEAFNENVSAANEYYDTLEKVAEANGMTTRELRKMRGEQDDLVDSYLRSEQYGLAWADALNVQTDALAENNEQTKTTAEQLKAISDENRSFLKTVEDVSGKLQGYNDGIAKADQELADGKITVEEHAAKVAELGATYEEASNRIILSLLEMKYTADGTFDDVELNKYLLAAEKLGVITEEDRQATIALYAEVETLDATLSTANGQAKEYADKLHNVQRKADLAAESALGLNDAQEILGDGISHNAYPAAAALAGELGSMPPSGTVWAYTFNITTNGSVPRVPERGDESGQGAGMANNAGVDSEYDTSQVPSFWTGGQMRGWTVVGDAPGGSWTPYTEVISPSGYVFNARQSKKLRDMGLLGDAVHMVSGGRAGYTAPDRQRRDNSDDSVVPVASAVVSAVPPVESTTTESVSAIHNAPPAAGQSGNYESAAAARSVKEIEQNGRMIELLEQLVGKIGSPRDNARALAALESKTS